MRHLKKIIVLTLCLLLIAGCTPAGNQPAVTPPAGQGQQQGPTPTPGDAPPAGPADVGTTFIFSGNANITQWDPLNENRTNTYMLNLLIYDFLVTPGPDYINMVPMLAESWSVSDNGLEWTFNLRSGVYFHNGEYFDSSSVVTTFQRLLDNPTLVHAGFWGFLESVRAEGPYTAVIVLNAPWGATLSQLASVPMLPPLMYAEMGDDMFIWDDNNRPIGTGPWIADVWLPGQDAEFIRNDDYWDWRGNPSTFERIIYRPLAEDATRVAGIQTRDLTMINHVPTESAAMLDAIDGITIGWRPSNAIVHLGFRTCEDDGNYRVFKDLRARQAVLHAIDIQGIVDAIVGSGAPSDWPAPPGVLGHDPARAFEWEFDPDLARELLAETDYEGQAIVFMVPMGVFARATEVAQAINAMLIDVGFTVDMQVMENAAFQQQRAAADYDLYIQGYGFPNGDPDSNIVLRWLNDAHMSGYVNEELNDLIRASRVETDPARREQILQDMFYVQWNTLAPHAALYTQVGAMAWLDGITGIRMRPDGIVDYSRVTFAR